MVCGSLNLFTCSKQIMITRFLYKDNALYDKDKEQLITKLVEEVSKRISLPDEVEIEMLNLGHSSYGQTVIDPKFRKRIKINATLGLREIIFPVVHELAHLHQIHEGKLMARRDGSIIWEGTLYNLKDPENMSYKEYRNLPWEQDADHKQKHLLREILGR